MDGAATLLYCKIEGGKEMSVGVKAVIFLEWMEGVG